VLNPDMFAEAEASDRRRREGKALGPLDGIPDTAKDSYKVRGLTVAAGSPAFEHLVANEVFWKRVKHCGFLTVAAAFLNSRSQCATGQVPEQLD
ncbi:amidase family protein, partial [Mesorhizobium sp. M4B.F.Ca.ET.214.01.1.1]|uniref:amidase family protein n=1 Tax=Mesorhizobium sp. M4B.F.Ca.ET.214.01.1.1 TaxID=2563955 RepID=UPI00113F8A76